MELVAVSEKSFKIKSKNSSFLINPAGKNDADVAVLTYPEEDFSQFGGKLVISGPGEYEIAQVIIKGEKTGENISFDFWEENQRILVLSSPSLVKDRDTEGYSATIVIMSEAKEDYTSQISSETIVLVGLQGFLPKGDIMKTDKMNLKKIEDYKGSIVYLSK